MKNKNNPITQSAYERQLGDKFLAQADREEASHPKRAKGELKLKQHSVHTACLADENDKILYKPNQDRSEGLPELLNRADRIVRAVNMHDELIGMLKRTHETLLSVYSNGNFGKETPVKQQALRDEMKDILELLKQASQK